MKKLSQTLLAHALLIGPLMAGGTVYAQDSLANLFGTGQAETPNVPTGQIDQTPAATQTAAPSRNAQAPAASAQASNAKTATTGTASTEKKKPSFRDRAFQQLLNQTIPMTPEQIVKLRQEIDKSQLAVSTAPKAPPQPVSSTMTLDLSPGATPSVIRLSQGFVTTLVFIDATGQPWPVADYNLGNPRDFNIQWDLKTNAMFIQSTKAHISGNMAVRLAELDTPIMLSLVTGQREVDYRVDLHVRGRGPYATAQVVNNSLPGSASATLLSALDGVPPPNSKQLVVPTNLGQAWLSENRLFFRTRLTVLSPAWSGSVSSIDGTHVYEMMPTPMILASQDGKPVKIFLEGF